MRKGPRGQAAAALLLLPILAAAQEEGRHAVLEQIEVIGHAEAVYSIPGSAHYVDYEEIRALAYDDINRILHFVPGVYVREEDGYGLFPNISLRGVDTSRSAKVTMMEDGILSAPAPYSAPSAYYSPTSGRMHGIEVLKGTSQVRYGPHITGGVVNYLSTPIPDSRHAFLRSQFGEDDDMRLHAYYGDTLETAAGRVGFLAEAYWRDADGFKRIDAAPGYPGSGDTGFYTIEPMVKLAWEPNTSVYQRFEFKYGHTDKEADETYLGLSSLDFDEDPYRRYAASRFDHINAEHHRSYLRHFISPTANFDLVTTIYYNIFRRNWYKLDDIRAAPGGLPVNMDLSAALAGAEGGAGLACLRGEIACGLRVRAGDREYYAWGIQSDATWRFESGAVAHALNFGIRYHRDEEDRFQLEDLYRQDASGVVASVVRGPQGGQDNREAETGALALYLQDEIEWGDWRFTPGIRYESLDLENRDFRPGRGTADTDLDMLSGGIGVMRRLTEAWQVFGGVHWGFSPPSPAGAVAGLGEETSIGYELGVRYADDLTGIVAEAVGFYTAFDDLIVVSNIGGTGTGTDENFGEVDAYGVEFSGRMDLARMQGWSFSNPWYVTFTYTHTEQQNDALSLDPESIFSFGAEGNEEPYIPEFQFTIGSSLDFDRWGVAANVTFVDDAFGSANNSTEELNGLGQPDARFGRIDSHTLVDVSAYAKLTEQFRVFAGVHNLFDEEYIASRQPHGPRPGLPQSWFAGLELDY